MARNVLIKIALGSFNIARLAEDLILTVTLPSPNQIELFKQLIAVIQRHSMLFCMDFKNGIIRIIFSNHLNDYIKEHPHDRR